MKMRLWKKKLLSAFVLIYLCLWFFENKSIAQPSPITFTCSPVTFLQEPISVRITTKEKKDDWIRLAIEVEYKKDHFSFETEGSEDWIKQYKNLIGWKGNYFFVPEGVECGSCHRGQIDQVLMMKGEHLVLVGEIIKNYGSEEPGTGFNDGIFEDIYNKFEMNGITDHADSPDILLAMREKDGHFYVDLEKTWDRNFHNYLRWYWKIKDEIHYRNEKRDLAYIPLYWVVDAAVVAKYCKQDQKLKDVLEKGRKLLTQEEMSRIDDLLKQVIPGEMNPMGDIEKSVKAEDK